MHSPCRPCSLPCRARLSLPHTGCCARLRTAEIAISKAGGIQHLIGWLASSEDEVQTHAARAMVAVVSNNATTQGLIGKLDGIAPLIKLVAKGCPEAQEQSACALWHLTSSEENRQAIIELGGITPIVSMLVAPSAVAAQIATMVTVRLTEGSAQAAIAVAEAGGISPLVRLLSRAGSEALQQAAAAALAALSLVPSNRDVVANAGGIRPLIALLKSGYVGTAETAARALAHIARDSSAGPPGEQPTDGAAEGAEQTGGADTPSGPLADEPANASTGMSDGGAGGSRGSSARRLARASTESSAGGSESESESDDGDGDVCGADMRRMVICNEGGIELLIAMLDGSNVAGHAGQSAHRGGASALGSAVTEGGSLVDVASRPNDAFSRLFPGCQADFAVRIGMQEQGAATLSDLAYRDHGMQDAIIEAGGVYPLLQMIRLSQLASLAQEHAARTLWYLCEHVENQREIVNLGAINEFVMLLRHGNPNAQEAAAAGIAEVARGAILAIERMHAAAGAGRGTGGEQGTMPGAPPRRRASISNKPRRASFVADLGRMLLPAEVPPADPTDPNGPANPKRPTEVPPADPTKAGQEDGAAAAAAGAGGKSGGEAVEADKGAAGEEDAASGKPREECEADAANRLEAVAECGGIVPLIKLAETGPTSAKEKAVAALWHLALHPENRASIASNGGIRPLVSLLELGTTVGQQYASQGLARLAIENPENQAQIAKRLVSLLDHDDASVVSRAAHDLQSLALEHQGAPVVIVNAGAIMPLVSVLSNGKTEEGRTEAAKTLEVLANSGKANQLAIAIGLVALLGAGTDQAQEYVTQLLLTLSSGSGTNSEADRANRLAIANAGPFKMLVQQLRSESKRVKQLAVALMAKMSGDSEENVAAIANASGIRHLVALLESDDGETQSNAASVLADMTRTEPKHAGVLAREGGIPLLVSLLQTSETIDAKAEAAGALANLATDHAHEVGDAGAIEPLVSLLRATDQRAQLKAAGALAGIAAGGSRNQDSIMAAGGIELLVGLLARKPAADEAAVAAAPPAVGGAASADGTAVAAALDDDASPVTAASARAGSPTAGLDDTSAQAEAPRAASELTDEQVQAEAARALTRLADGNPACQAAVSACGGVALLIELIDRSASEEPKETAAGVLWKLAAEHAANQATIAEARGIESLVRYVGCAAEEGQDKAALALASLGLDHPANRTTIATLLVALLRDTPPTHVAREKAARAVSRFARAHPSNPDALADAGAVALAVSQLAPRKASADARHSMVGSRAGGDADGAEAALRQHVETHKQLCASLWSLSEGNASNQAAIAEEGGIPLLIRLLDDHSGIHRDAAGALWSLAADATNQRLIAAAEGIAPLVELLQPTRKNKEPQDTAAGALHSLAMRLENRTLIADAGGIGLLAALFQGAPAAAKAEVEGALLTLARDNLANQFSIAQKLVALIVAGPDDATEATNDVGYARVEAQEHATSVLLQLSADRDNREALSSANACYQLIRQLRGGTDKAQGMAAVALTQLARMSTELRIQVVQSLVGLLSSADGDVRRRAGNALRDMNTKVEGSGNEDTKGQREAAMAGGVAPLVELLKDGLHDENVEAQEYSLWSLSLTTDASRRATMVGAGVIPPLVRSLEGGQLSEIAQQHAAMVISCLAIDRANHEEMLRSNAIPPLVHLTCHATFGAKKYAATGLARLALENPATQERIFEAGAVQPLVTWLVDGTIGPPETAALALADFAAHENAQMQARIAEAGAIVPLIAMLQITMGTEQQRSAAHALATLARGCAPNQALIASCEGIPPLVEILKSSPWSKHAGAHKSASYALAMLAADESNKMEIARCATASPRERGWPRRRAPRPRGPRGHPIYASVPATGCPTTRDQTTPCFAHAAHIVLRVPAPPPPVALAGWVGFPLW